MNVLIACEESQAVCTCFRNRGANAFSCDIQVCSGGHPEWHINSDVLAILGGNCTFKTQDGEEHTITGKWDLIIAHPPCTFLTVTGNRWFNVERYGDYARDRLKERELAVEFFMQFVNCNCEKLAIENPIGCMSTRYKTPNQVIQPWMFGHPTTKSTCLWLRGLPELKKTNVVDVDTSDIYEYVAANGKIKHDSRNRSKCKKEDRSKHRSKTFEGIAQAMAEQWYNYILKENEK